MIGWLHETVDADAGGKATALNAMLRAELPVPPGFAISARAWSETGPTARGAALEVALGQLGAARVAVRSSAVDEDGAGASFAGIHTTRLNVAARVDAVVSALEAVHASGREAAAIAYRRRHGLPEDAPMGAVVQAMVPADVAGVVFGRHPVTGDDRLVIEASWGLGEGLVSGLVTPDHFELSPDGRVLAQVVADKDLAVVATGDATSEVDVPEDRRCIACLTERDLARLVELTAACRRLFGGPQDIEFARAGEQIVLLQSRPITS